jgi:hypothetical protein
MNFYTTSMVEFISRASHGLIRIDPKDKQGRPLRRLKEAIIELDGTASRITGVEGMGGIGRLYEDLPR